MPGDSTLDPRYDPRFQRGYDPRLHPAPSAEDAPSRSERGAAADSSPAARSDAVAGPASPDTAAPDAGPDAAARNSAARNSAAPDFGTPRTAAPEPGVPAPDGVAEDGWYPLEDETAPAAASDAPGSRSGLAFWRNPYLVALAVVGVGLIVFGLNRYTWASGVLIPLWHSRTTTGASAIPAGDTLVTAQVLWAVSPLLIVAGVFCLAGIVFFAALRWRPRRSGGEEG